MSIIGHHGLLLGGVPTAYGPLIQYLGPAWYAKLADNAASSTVAATVGANGSLLAVTNGSTTRLSKNTSLVAAASLLTSGADGAFNLAGSSVVQGPNVALSGATGWTHTFLCKPSASTPSGNGGNGSVCQFGDAAGADSGCAQLDYQDSGGGSFRLRLLRSGVAEIGLTSTTWTYGTKLFIVLRHLAAGNIEVWVNGVRELNVASPGFTYARSSFWYGAARFGGATITFYQLTGTLDELAVFNRPLSDAQMAALFAAS